MKLNASAECATEVELPSASTVGEKARLPLQTAIPFFSSAPASRCQITSCLGTGRRGKVEV